MIVAASVVNSFYLFNLAALHPLYGRFTYDLPGKEEWEWGLVPSSPVPPLPVYVIFWVVVASCSLCVDV